MTAPFLEARQTRTNLSWTSKIADATVVRRGRRPRSMYEQMKRGLLRPHGISPSNMVYVRLHAARMLKIYRRFENVEMTPEERQQFEIAVIDYKGRPASESFALVSISINRVASKVDEVLAILKNDVRPKP